MDQPPPRGPGRPAHEPTAQLRQQVADLVGEGRSVAQVAEDIGLSEPTVRLHYADELRDARPQLFFPFPEIRGAVKKQKRADPGGRPAHKPTDETRQRVQILTASGMPAWQIASVMLISEPTLRLHYEGDLQLGRASKTAEVIEALFLSAKGGNVSAQKAWLAQFRQLNDPPQSDAPPANQPVGKKDATRAAALSAEMGTGWDGLLPN
ncbi:MAG: hypothetical protein JWR10_3427 [Rubritepida sp.]|nr:hypothetical protein [Rubritepida sp.]